MSLESSSIHSGAGHCWTRPGSVWPSRLEYCIDWLLRPRNYWKLISAVKPIIWRLRNIDRHQRGESRASYHYFTTSVSIMIIYSKIFVFSMKCNLMALLSPVSPASKLRRASLMNVFGSIQVIEPFTFFYQKTEPFACFSLAWWCFRWEESVPLLFCHIISLDQSKDSIEQKFPSI